MVINVSQRQILFFDEGIKYCCLTNLLFYNSLNAEFQSYDFEQKDVD